MYLLFLCLFLTSTIFTSQKPIPVSSLSPSNALFDRVVYENIDGTEVKKNTVNRTLLIFLDDSEYAAKKLGSLSIQSLIAISDQACPILISVSLLMNIFRIASTQGLAFQKMCQSIVDALEAESWICREVIQTSGLILMIPKNYLKGQTISQSTNNFAFYLGLLAPTPFPHEEKSFNTALVKRYKKFKKSKKSISEDFIETLENVFLSNKDYVNKKDYSLPQWSIYISGHGQGGEKVAGIRMPYFKNLLDFLNSKITTKFLVYYTCFSTGKTEQNLFDASGKISKKSYSFPIMSMGIAEAQTFASLSEKEAKSSPGTIVYKTNFEFEEFVEKATSSKPAPYLELATSLIPTLHNVITGNLESFYALGSVEFLA